MDNEKKTGDPLEPMMEEIEAAVTGSPEGIEDGEARALAQRCTDAAMLRALLPRLKAMADRFRTAMEQCSEKAAMFSGSKRRWKTYIDSLAAVAGYMAEGCGQKRFAEGDARVTVTETETVVCDEEALLQPYLRSPEYCFLQNALPPWAKVSLAVDRTVLKAHLKKDRSLLEEHPDWVHTAISRSVCLK